MLYYYLYKYDLIIRVPKYAYFLYSNLNIWHLLISSSCGGAYGGALIVASTMLAAITCHIDNCIFVGYIARMKQVDVKKSLDEHINKESSSPGCIAFVNSLKQNGNISAGLAVYALAFYSGVEMALASRGETIEP